MRMLKKSLGKRATGAELLDLAMTAVQIMQFRSAIADLEKLRIAVQLTQVQHALLQSSVEDLDTASGRFGFNLLRWVKKGRPLLAGRVTQIKQEALILWSKLSSFLLISYTFSTPSNAKAKLSAFHLSAMWYDVRGVSSVGVARAPNVFDPFHT